MVPEGRVMDIESGQGPTAKKGRLKTTSVNHYWYTFTYKYNTNATGSVSIYMVSIFSVYASKRKAATPRLSVPP